MVVLVGIAAALKVVEVCDDNGYSSSSYSLIGKSSISRSNDIAIVFILLISALITH